MNSGAPASATSTCPPTGRGAPVTIRRRAAQDRPPKVRDLPRRHGTEPFDAVDQMRGEQMHESDRTQDRWAAWLLSRRQGGDATQREAMWQRMARWRDRVLDNAQVQPGDSVLDVGCGDGLIALGALDRVGPSGQVIFSDISQELLDHCAELARELGHAGQCDFIRASADDLVPLADASVDVVTTRSVLIFA